MLGSGSPPVYHHGYKPFLGQRRSHERLPKHFLLPMGRRVAVSKPCQSACADRLVRCSLRREAKGWLQLAGIDS